MKGASVWMDDGLQILYSMLLFIVTKHFMRKRLLLLFLTEL